MGLLKRLFFAVAICALVVRAHGGDGRDDDDDDDGRRGDGRRDDTCSRTSGAFIKQRGDSYYLDLPSIRPSWEGVGADAVLKGDIIEMGSVGAWLPNCKGCVPINAGDNVNQTFTNMVKIEESFGASIYDTVHLPTQANDSYALNATVANDALLLRQRAAQVQESMWGRCAYDPTASNCSYPARSFARSEVEGGFLIQPTAYIGDRLDTRSNRLSCIHDAAKGRTCVTTKNLPSTCPTVAGRQGFFAGLDCHYDRPTTLDYGKVFQVCYRPNGGPNGNGQLICGNASFDTCQRGFGPVAELTLNNSAGQPQLGLCWYRGIKYNCTDFVRTSLWDPVGASTWTWGRFKDVPNINVLAAWDHNDNAGRTLNFVDRNDLVRLNVFYSNPTRDHNLTLVETRKRFDPSCGPVLFFEHIDLVNNDTYEVTSKRYALPRVCSGRSNRDPLTPYKLENFSNARRFGYDAITSQHAGYDCTPAGCVLRPTLRGRIQRAYEVALESLMAVNIQREESVTEVICYYRKGLFEEVKNALGDLLAIRFPDPATRPVPIFAGHNSVYPALPSAGGVSVQLGNDVVIGLAAYEIRSAL